MDHDVDVLKDLLGAHISNELARLCLIILTLLLTWVLRWLISQIMPRMVRFLARSTQSTLDEKLIIALHPPLRFLIGILGLGLSFMFLGMPDRFLSRLIVSLVAFAVFWAMYRAVDLIVVVFERLMIYSKLGEASVLGSKLMLLIRQLTKGLIIVFAVVFILERWDFNVGGVLAGLGLGGLAIALAAQDALANLIGYFMILADEPYLIGEYIIVDDKAGIVEGIGFRSTRIRVLDQSLIVIPNKIMESEAITNWSRLNKRRLDVTLGLSYKSTTGQVLCVVQDIRQMLVAHSLVYPDSVLVQFTELADNALNLTILCFVKTPSWHDFQSVRQDINLKILDIMAKWSVDNANPEFDINIEPKPIQQLTVQEIVSPAPPATS